MDIFNKKHLNDEQLLAVTSKAKKLRIVAGAGTGKTRVLTYRICYLIEELKVNPKNIVAITFTNKVANEMTTRVHDLLKDKINNKNKPFISTFHSLALRILKMYIDRLPGYTKDFTIIDDTDQFRAFFACTSDSSQILNNKENAEAFKLFEGDKKLTKNEIKVYREKISNIKNMGIQHYQVTEKDVPPSVEPIYTFEYVKALYDLYSNYLKSINAMDFDDLLLYANYIIENNDDVREYCQKHFKAILVDEFQDTNHLQLKFLKNISTDKTLMTFVGDPDQSIYSWRGADTNIIVNEVKEVFPDLEDLKLTRNYRSIPDVIKHANKLISYNTMRIDKNLEAYRKDKGRGVRCYDFLDCDNEAIHIADSIKRMHDVNKVKYKDIAVIYRANYLVKCFEKCFNERGIPYQIFGGTKFYERQEIKDALAYLRLLVNPDDNISFERVMKAPSRGAGDVVFERARRQHPELSLFRSFEIQDFKVTKRTDADMKVFYTEYNRISKALENNMTNKEKVVKLVRDYFESMGFMDYVKELAEKKDEPTPMQNIDELVNSIEHFFDNYTDVNPIFPTDSKPSLDLFLQYATLQTSQDALNKADGQVKLMTVHVSKGLEFPVVFVVGLVENIFPSIRNNAELDNLEEERRLLFVAMTRAQEELILSCYKGYSKVNQGNNNTSRFVAETGVDVEQVNVQLDNSKVLGDLGNNGQAKHIKDNNWQKKSRALTKKADDSTVNQNLGHAFKHNATDVNYKLGDKVRHLKFGVGKIIELNGGKAKVDFKEGIKTVMLGHSSISKA